MTTPIPKSKLAEMRERCEKATKGPWGAVKYNPNIIAPEAEVDKPIGYAIDQRRDSEFCQYVASTHGADSEFEHRLTRLKALENADFIAHSRTDIPALLDEVERLLGVFDEIEGMEGEEEMTDAKFAERVLELSRKALTGE